MNRAGVRWFRREDPQNTGLRPNSGIGALMGEVLGTSTLLPACQPTVGQHCTAELKLKYK